MAKKKVAQHYEAIYYDGWGTPAYHLLDSMEGESPERALRDNLPHLTAQVRELFGLSRDDIPDEDIQETLYVIRSDGLVSVHNLERTNW